MKKKQTNYAPHLFISLFAFCLWVSFPGCDKAKEECRYEFGECPDRSCTKYHATGIEYVEYFKQGDTIYPSYVCQDTMVVVDAEGFNRDMGKIEQGLIDGTDGDLDSLQHLYCIPLR